MKLSIGNINETINLICGLEKSSSEQVYDVSSQDEKLLISSPQGTVEVDYTGNNRKIIVTFDGKESRIWENEQISIQAIREYIKMYESSSAKD